MCDRNLSCAGLVWLCAEWLVRDRRYVEMRFFLGFVVEYLLQHIQFRSLAVVPSICMRRLFVALINAYGRDGGVGEKGKGMEKKIAGGLIWDEEIPKDLGYFRRSFNPREQEEFLEMVCEYPIEGIVFPASVFVERKEFILRIAQKGIAPIPRVKKGKMQALQSLKDVDDSLRVAMFRMEGDVSSCVRFVELCEELSILPMIQIQNASREGNEIEMLFQSVDSSKVVLLLGLAMWEILERIPKNVKGLYFFPGPNGLFPLCTVVEKTRSMLGGRNIGLLLSWYLSMQARVMLCPETGCRVQAGKRLFGLFRVVKSQPLPSTVEIIGNLFWGKNQDEE